MEQWAQLLAECLSGFSSAPGFPGISAGRGNWKAKAQGVRTRIENGNDSNMSLKTAPKGAVGTQAADSYRTAGEAAADAAKSKICGANKGACE
jgi:hypothetical protein